MCTYEVVADLSIVKIKLADIRHQGPLPVEEVQTDAPTYRLLMPSVGVNCCGSPQGGPPLVFDLLRLVGFEVRRWRHIKLEFSS